MVEGKLHYLLTNQIIDTPWSIFRYTFLFIAVKYMCVSVAGYFSSNLLHIVSIYQTGSPTENGKLQKLANFDTNLVFII